MYKTETICRLCLQISESDFEIIDEITKSILDALCLKVDLSLSKKPGICKNCATVLQKSFDLMSTCQNTKDSKSFSVNENAIERCNNLNGSIINNTDYRACQFCTQFVKKGYYASLNQLERDLVAMKDVLPNCVLDLYIIAVEEPVLCEFCNDSIQSHITFLKNWLEVEYKIKHYYEIGETGGKDQIDLGDVLQYFLLQPEAEAKNLSLVNHDKSICQTENSITTILQTKNEEFILPEHQLKTETEVIDITSGNSDARKKHLLSTGSQAEAGSTSSLSPGSILSPDPPDFSHDEESDEDSEGHYEDFFSDNGNGNDLTPNPRKLHNTDKELDKLGIITNDMTPVRELPFTVRPASRKERNNLASRACRLRKKAHHEAIKIKLNGLEIEHKRLLNGISQAKQILAAKVTEQSPQRQEELMMNIEKILKNCAGDGNDLTPNPRILHNVGKKVDKLDRIIYDMTPISELPFTVRPTSRKEQNNLAARAYRLRQKAHHEAIKIKLNGLETEHKRLLNGISQAMQILTAKITEPSPQRQEELMMNIEKILKNCAKSDDEECKLEGPDCSVRGIKHSGKARKDNGNDLTPNPRKLHNIGRELDKLGRITNDMTPVNELPFTVRPTSRKERNNLASRACRLKKQAQHEANKIKLNGLETEHKLLLNGISQAKQILAAKITEQSPQRQEELTMNIEKILKNCAKVRIAGHTTKYVDKILDKLKNGVTTTRAAEDL